MDKNAAQASFTQILVPEKIKEKKKSRKRNKSGEKLASVVVGRRSNPRDLNLMHKFTESFVRLNTPGSLTTSVYGNFQVPEGLWE